MRKLKVISRNVTLVSLKSNLLKQYLLTFMILSILVPVSIYAQNAESSKSSSSLSELEEQFDFKNAYVFDGLELKNLQHRSTGEAVKSEEVYLERNLGKFNEILQKYPNNLVLNVPVSTSNTLELLLMKSNIIADDFTSRNENNELVSLSEKGLFYQGKIKGMPNSTVAVSIFENKIDAMILGAKENYAIKDGPDGQSVLSKISGQLKKDVLNGHENGYVCHMEGEQDNDEIELEIPEGKFDINNYKTHCNSLKLKYVIDRTLYLHFNNWSTTVNYILTRFNEIDAIYNSYYLTYGWYELPLECAAINYHRNYFTSTQTNTIINNANNDPNKHPDTELVSAYIDALQNENLNGSSTWGACQVVFFNNNMTNSYGLGVTNQGGQVPICNPAPYIFGYGPFAATGVKETGTAAADYYITTILGHELGHNYGRGHNSSPDLMGSGGHYLDLYQSLYPMYVIQHDCICYSSKTDGQKDKEILDLVDEVTIFPNPVENSLSLQLSESFSKNTDEIILEIFNIEGKLVLTTKKSRDRTINIDISKLPNNQEYFVSIKDNGTTISKRFVKK